MTVRAFQKSVNISFVFFTFKSMEFSLHQGVKGGRGGGGGGIVRYILAALLERSALCRCLKVVQFGISRFRNVVEKFK